MTALTETNNTILVHANGESTTVDRMCKTVLLISSAISQGLGDMGEYVTELMQKSTSF